MIVEYNRPTSLDEALILLQRDQPVTLPLAGGTALVASTGPGVAVVDLQSLGLDTIEVQSNSLLLGATLRLQDLLNWIDAAAGRPADDRSGMSTLAAVVRHEATYNLRQAATVAGTLVAAGGRSPLATALLALDAVLTLQPGDDTLGLGDLLPVRRERLRTRLITRITLPLNTRLAYEYVARTPADRPIVCAAAALWPSGRVRVALGGYGAAPALAVDGPEIDGCTTAARSAYSQAGDQWASAEYRAEMAAVLTGRCLDALAKTIL